MLDELRKKKLAEFQDKLLAEQNETLQSQLEEQQKMQQQIETLEEIAKKFLTKESLERYGRIKLAHKAIAIKAIAIISQAAQMGQLTEEINDEEFKKLLEKLQEGRKEFNFKN